MNHQEALALATRESYIGLRSRDPLAWCVVLGDHDNALRLLYRSLAEARDFLYTVRTTRAACLTLNITNEHDFRVGLKAMSLKGTPQQRLPLLLDQLK